VADPFDKVYQSVITSHVPWPPVWFWGRKLCRLTKADLS
jgi:hypothetical protein